MDRQAIGVLQDQIDRYTTMMYRPPEMVDFYQQYIISEKVDIWMLGCILFTLMFCAGRPWSLRPRCVPLSWRWG